MSENIKQVLNSRRLKVELFITPKMVKSDNEKMNMCNICGVVLFHKLSEKEMKKHLDLHTDAELLDKLGESPCISGVKIIPDSTCSQEKIMQNIWDNNDDVWDKIGSEINENNPGDYTCSSTMAWKKEESNNDKSKHDVAKNNDSTSYSLNKGELGIHVVNPSVEQFQALEPYRIDKPITTLGDALKHLGKNKATKKELDCIIEDYANWKKEALEQW